MKFETKAIHKGQEPDSLTGSVTVPIYQTSTYEQEAVGKHKGFEYSRTGNPTRKALECALASLESSKYGLAFASGVAATNAVLNLMKKGDHVVSGDDIYGGTYRLFEKVFRRWGLSISYADVNDINNFKKAIRKNTKLIWIETPTNPLLKIIDIKKLSEIAKKKNIILAVDNTFATPYFQRPIELGADIVVHSTTKYLSGHSDIIGGAVITSNEKIYNDLKFYQNAAGAVPSPFDSWLVLRGIKTLAVRMREHELNALYLIEYLKGHPKIEKVYFPGLPNNKNYDIAKKQMSGFGGMISFELKGGLEAGKKFIDALQICVRAISFGTPDTLLSHPASMSHMGLSKEERLQFDITDGLIRLSVGIENVEDIIADFEQALNTL